MIKDILYNEEMRKHLVSGMDKVADAVKVTLGPKGRNVIMYQKASLRDTEYSDRAQKGAHALVTNDGVTIAKAIVLPNPAENMGAELIKEAAIKTNDTAGDGTTTATVLAQAILKEGVRNLAAGAHPMALRKGITGAAEAAIEQLIATAKSVDSQDALSCIAAISCQDTSLGEMIGEAIYRVGLEGVVQVEDSGKAETTLDVMEGIVFERGFLSPLMATDEHQTFAELHNPYILLYDGKIENPQDLIPILIQVAETDRSCLILSDGVEGEAMGLILRNKLEGDLDIVCVTAPLYGEGREWRLDDMAVQTGGTFISKKMGLTLQEATLDMLGTAAYVKVTKNQTVITGPGGDPEAVEARVKELKYMAAHTDYEFNRKRYEERLAKFVSGVAKIDVGGRTEPELWERKMRAEDAVNAARAAYEEGIVAGGGIAFLNILPAVRDYADTLEGDEKTGAQILLRALEAPARQIAENADLDGSAVVGRLKEEGVDMGYDAERGVYINLVEAGIIDPVKVSRMALSAAVSVCGTMLTGEAGMYDHTEARKEG